MVGKHCTEFAFLLWFFFFQGEVGGTKIVLVLVVEMRK